MIMLIFALVLNGGALAFYIYAWSKDRERKRSNLTFAWVHLFVCLALAATWYAVS